MHSNGTNTSHNTAFPQINIENLLDAEFKALLDESKKKLDELSARIEGKPSLLQQAQQNQDLDALNKYYQIAVNYFKLFGVNYTTAYDSELYQRTILYWAIACFQDSGILEELLQHGSTANEAYYDDENYALISAFSIAVQLKNLEAVRILLKHCPDLAVQRSAEHGDMPAHYAAQHDAVEILEELYKVIPEVTHIPTGPLDIAPLHTAAMFGRVKAAAWILEHDPKTCNLANSSGYTALHFAVVNAHPEVTALLLKHGADVSLRTKPSTKLPEKTALQLAADAGNNDIVRILLQHEEKLDKDKTPDYSGLISHLRFAPVNYSKLNESMRIVFALLDYIDRREKEPKLLNTFFGANPYAIPGPVKTAAASILIHNLLNNAPDPFVNMKDEHLEALRDKYSRDKDGLRAIVAPLLDKFRPGSKRASPVTPNKLSPQMR